MRVFQAPHRIGSPRARDAGLLTEAANRLTLEPRVKTASVKVDVQKLAFDLGLHGLTRVAGNVYIVPPTGDLWKVSGEKLTRLVSSEADMDESMTPADHNHPEAHLNAILADLEY